ncbi:CHASE domain-containing protein [Ideonella sp. DXS29W]|uniref:histidine kinase n=1 Tax=Ideonella lacteola TaxID=2984193 RepID=A0ABU9BQY9_9BURK
MVRRLALPLMLPLGVGAVALAVTLGLWSHERLTAERALRSDFDAQVRQTASRIEQRMASFEQMLRGVQGLYLSEEVEGRRELAMYVDTLLAGADASGVQWFAFAPWQPAASADGVPGAGAEGRAPLIEIAPAAGLHLRALGDDVFADPQRRAALQTARDAGGLAITPRLLLPADASGAREPGFFMVLPVYRRGQPTDSAAARRAALQGWVLASVRMDDLMSSLYGESAHGLSIHVHDGVTAGEDNLMYASEPERPEVVQLSAREYLGFAGHSWTLDVQALPEFERRQPANAATVIALAGMVLSLMLGVITHQLVTGRQRAHELARRMTMALRASEERYRRIVETADEGIWVADADGLTTFANRKMAHLLGVTATALIGRPMAEFFEPDNVAGAVVAKAMGRVNGQTVGSAPAQDAGGASRERRLCRADGTKLWALIATTPIVDDRGRFGGTLAMVTDISAQKQAEVAHAEIEVQLRASQKMEAIGTLAGGIAHDFNNILAAILGNVALAQQEPLEPTVRGRLSLVTQSAERARSLVQQILAFSRRQPHSLKSQALAPVIEESVRLLRPLLPAMVQLEFTAPAQPITVRADATQLHQVLMNLCTNAWHAMEGLAGRIDIRLDTRSFDTHAAQRLGMQAGAYAHLAVADNGTGMDEATRQRLFEPFFTTKPVGQGTGLGLAVVHGIVSAHHGAISVRSARGEGTCFDLYFPLEPEPPAADIVAEPSAREAAAPISRQVVYIDDDPVMVVMVEGLLRHAGYRVRTFEHPREALAWLRAHVAEADLVVTDFNMPGLSGLAVAGELASLRPDLPVVISSGYVTEALLDAAQRIGVRSVMQKEFTLEQLPPLLRRLLVEPSATV